MTYDYRNLMVEYADSATGMTIQYAYDVLGRRVLRSLHGHQTETTTYSYDGGAVIEERDAGGNTLATYVYGTTPKEVVTAQRAAVDVYYHTDALGSVSAITGNAGQLIERYEYDDFGEPSLFDAQDRRLQASAVRNPFLFTGQPYEAGTGLYDYGSRHFDPRAGRFTARDPIGIWEDAGNLGNGYTYAHNNPQTLVDPRGASIERTIACGGPWPGPRSVMIEYEGCAKSRRQTLDVPVCRAFRASGRSFSDVQALWMFDLSGVSFSPTGTGPGTVRPRVEKWFGGPDKTTSTSSKQVISGDLYNVYDALKTNDVDIGWS
jgi:RHS repeat-associated protein